MVSGQMYTYSEILEMLPYERDAFHAMMEEDAYKEQQRINQRNQIV